MPLDNAIYVSSKDKIYGSMGPCIGVFDATGKEESFTRVLDTAERPTFICWHGSSLYISAWDIPVGKANDEQMTTRDIFPVDPDTLALGTGLFLCENAKMSWSAYQVGFYNGPGYLRSIGTNILFVWYGESATTFGRIDPSNPAAFIGNSLADPSDVGLTMPDFHYEIFGFDGTYAYMAWPYGPDIAKIDTTATKMNPTSYCGITPGDTGIVTPFSAEYCALNGLVYAVCGNQYLVRVNSFGASDYTTFNLDLVSSNCAPFRLRYNTYDGKLYIPCQNRNVVIVWNPALDTVGSAVVKTGFDGPLDVVFTPTKSFAVQSGVVSLKEIT